MARSTLHSSVLLTQLRGSSALTAASLLASFALVACGSETEEKSEDTGSSCNLFTGEGCDDASDTSVDSDTSSDSGVADTEDDTSVEDTEVDTNPDDTGTDTTDDTTDTNVTPELCGNGTDDDGDGNADCADVDCVNNAACLECATIDARDCEPANRACVAADGVDACGGCLDGFIEQAGACVCDGTVCNAPPEPSCRGNSRVETSTTAYDIGTACECRSAEVATPCPSGTRCDAGACVAVPVVEDPWVLFVRTPGSACTEQQASQLYVIRADGTDERRVTNLPGQKLAARWSPDGRSVYFSMKVTDCSAPANTNVGIYKLAIETGAVEQLAPVCPELAYQGSPDPTGLLSGGFAILPDESAIVFTNFYNGDFGLFTQPLAPASGLECTVLADTTSGEADPAIPECDPTTVIYTKQASGGAVTLFSVGTDASGNRTASLTGYLGAPAISPAGTSAIWTKPTSGGSTQLFSSTFDCAGHRTTSSGTAVSGSVDDSSPAFFPNGNLIATERIFASATVVQTEIMLLNVATGVTNRLTTNEVLDGGPRPGVIEATSINPAIAR